MSKSSFTLLETLDPVAISLCWQTVSKSSFALLETLDPVAIPLCWQTVSKSSFTLLETLDPVAISLCWGTVSIMFHFVENVLPRSSRLSGGNRHGEEAE